MKTLKELRAVILVLGVYLTFGCYLWAGNYANMRLERTYEIKYRYMMMVTMVIFWLAAAAAIALLGGIMKKRFLWVEIVLIDIPAVLMLLAQVLYFTVPNLPMLVGVFSDKLMVLGAVLAGCEAVRYVRYFRNGRSPYKRIV